MSDLAAAMPQSPLSLSRSAEDDARRAGARLEGERAGVTPEMRDAAQEFEAVFLAQMLRPMFDTIETSETFGGGSGEDQYRQLLVDEYGKAMARAGGIGLADHVLDHMLKLQETQQR